MARYDVPEPPPDYYAPVIPWDTFFHRVFDWDQQQHIGTIGPTEQGKTNLIWHLLQLRQYVAYLGIKSQDETLDRFASVGGFTRVWEYPPKVGRVRKREPSWEEMPRRLVWPDARDRRAARDVQRAAFGAALDDAWSSGGVCVVWDDFWYLVRILGMELDAKQNLLNARSAWSPQVISAQRGAGNRMVELTDQPTWLFWFRETDPRNLQLLGPANSLRRGYVQHLERYQFLAENTRTGVLYRSKAPKL